MTGAAPGPEATVGDGAARHAAGAAPGPEATAGDGAARHAAGAAPGPEATAGDGAARLATIAPLDLTDGPIVAALLAVQRAAYAVEAELVGSDAIPALHETAAELAGCGEDFLGAFDGERLCGAVSYQRAGRTIDIHRLVVHPSAFRRGVASALLDAVAAREPDATRWLVATAAANEPARALYAARGFTVAAQRTVGDGLQIVELQHSPLGGP